MVQVQLAEKILEQKLSSTIGEQKANELRSCKIFQVRIQFIEEVTNGLLAPPSYFFTDVSMNKNGL